MKSGLFASVVDAGYSVMGTSIDRLVVPVSCFRAGSVDLLDVAAHLRLVN